MFSLALMPAFFQGGPVTLVPGQEITGSCRIAKQVYMMPTPQGEEPAGDERIPTLKAAVTIHGDGITVDFAGATLRGSDERAMPDERKGLAVLVLGNNVTIKNLNVHGYKVGVLARNCRGLKVLNSDLSYNWKQHLASDVDKEDESDWMSYHHNENGEWLRYGAGIYLTGCEGFEVKNVKIVGGQCGLMLNRSNGGTVWNNDFSFLSGVGLGLYRSSNNRVMHNRIDWCVRGFSYGVYNRGQDSAGILIFEQCNKNVFAYNSVTHGGDGFFLWAGQTTMDTGKGGCNDNLLYGNDFSHAPTNGIEATFSRNRFVNNKVYECAHAVWGGYSYDTLIQNNDFADNQAGIAIEHGQANTFVGNRFNGDDVGISLWANASQDPNWGYPKNHDTLSRDPKIVGNTFWHTPLAIDMRGTSHAQIADNKFYGVDQALRLGPDGKATAITETKGNQFLSGTPVPPELSASAEASRPMQQTWDPMRKGEYAPSPLPGGTNPFLAKNALRGWRYILVDDWGPYDFQRPLLWPERLPLNGEAPRPGADSAAGSGKKAKSTGKPISATRYEILGPKGRWRLVSSSGAIVSAKEGVVPGFVDIQTEPGHAGLTEVKMEYVGAPTTDIRGVVTPMGQAVPFGFSKFFVPVEWNVKFFGWKESIDARDPHAAPKAYASIIRTTPLKEMTTDRVDFAGGALVRGLPNDHYATLADGTFTVPEGDYTVEITSDDGARLSLDGQLIVDEWHYEAPTQYKRTVHLAAGKHAFHLEHFQIDGYATLKVTIKPK